MSTQLEMKGAAFHSMLDAIEELDGKDARERVIAALSEPLGTAVRSAALTRVGWYPIEDYNLLHEAIQATLGGGDRKARELGRKSTEIDTRGLLRYVLAITTPSLLVRHANRVFGSYIRGGTITATKRQPGMFDLAFTNMTSATRYLFPEWEGGIGLLLELSGATNVNVRRAPQLTEEDGVVVLVASWGTDAG